MYIAHYRKSDETSESVADHCFNVAEMSKLNAKKIGLECIGEICGLLHDIGKTSSEFQNYIKSAEGLIDQDSDDYVDSDGNRGKVDHSTSGAQFIWKMLNEGLTNEGAIDVKKSVTGQIISLCVCSHHSGLIDCISPVGLDVFSKRMSKDYSVTNFDEVKSKIESSNLARRIEDIVKSGNLEKEISKVLEIIKSEKASKTVNSFKMSLLVRFLFSCLIDADRISTSDFEFPYHKKNRRNGNYVDWGKLIARLDDGVANLKNNSNISKIQSDVYEQCKKASSRSMGIFKLTAPTGSGKTFSSMCFAMRHAQKNGAKRVIYVAPYTSIIDQNSNDVREILEKGEEFGSVVLEIHSNVSPNKNTWKSKLLSESWDSPMVFTTFVQFVNVIFSHKNSDARLMHQLAESVIVIDEVQSIPVRMIHIFNNAMNFLTKHCKSSVVLCTATQPPLCKVNKDNGAICIHHAHEIIEDPIKLSALLRRVEVFDKTKTLGWKIGEIVNLVGEEFEKSGNVLVITNTKSCAEELYCHCRDMFPNIVRHLSTYMCSAHRMEVLKEVKEKLINKEPIICISTQLIEAGINIDFGSVIRYTGGIESINQAGGRCNRYGKRDSGRLTVINPELTVKYEKSLEKLVDIKVGIECTEFFLREYKKNSKNFDDDMIGVKAIAWYYECYYKRRSGEMSYNIDRSTNIGRSDNLLSLLSLNDASVESYKRRCGKSPNYILKQSFMSGSKEFEAIDSPAEGVLVPYKDGAEYIKELCSCSDPIKIKRILNQCQRYSINIFPEMRRKLIGLGCLTETQPGSGIVYLDPRHYSLEFGVTLDPLPMPTLIV